jgi:hypothetical protein
MIYFTRILIICLKFIKREENPKLGMPNELLYSVAKQFGWNLTMEINIKILWQYVLGTNETGTPTNRIFISRRS